MHWRRHNVTALIQLLHTLQSAFLADKGPPSQQSSCLIPTTGRSFLLPCGERWALLVSSLLMTTVVERASYGIMVLQRPKEEGEGGREAAEGRGRGMRASRGGSQEGSRGGGGR